jgi:hypothetical protein
VLSEVFFSLFILFLSGKVILYLSDYCCMIGDEPITDFVGKFSHHIGLIGPAVQRYLKRLPDNFPKKESIKQALAAIQRTYVIQSGDEQATTRAQGL